MKQTFQTKKHKIDQWLDNNEILQGLFWRNDWLWAHLIGGAVLGKIFNIFLSDGITILVVFAIAILWELFEHFVDTPNHFLERQVYGSVRAYWLDTTADVLGAVLMAAIVVI